MPVILQGQVYYRISDVCRMAGVSRSSLWRWTKAGILRDAAKRDRRGWRLFTAAEIRKIASEAQRAE